MGGGGAIFVLDKMGVKVIRMRRDVYAERRLRVFGGGDRDLDGPSNKFATERLRFPLSAMMDLPRFIAPQKSHSSAHYRYAAGIERARNIQTVPLSLQRVWSHVRTNESICPAFHAQ